MCDEEKKSGKVRESNNAHYRSKSEQHKNESVQNFAQGLVGLTKIIKEATKLESEAHDVPLI